jgi:hypothetical protein
MGWVGLMALGSLTATLIPARLRASVAYLGSGRYSIINSMGNVPVVYMLTLDGWGGNRWGARGLSGTEAVMGRWARRCY